ncbi:MAG: U32 family peptidase [Candidatus Lokiarchaeota archaeon]|nr:U32 family peptidase [Candidatus Lokiarchaeota archaeon]
MQFSVAYNWDPRLIEEVVKNKYPVYEFYASAQHTTVGGGRPSFILPGPDDDAMRAQIERMHEHRIEFAYALNAPCMGGQEFVRETHEKLIGELQWIQDMGCDSVILTIPYLMEIVKEQFPKLKVRVSTIAKVNTVNKARFFEALGASAITPDTMINRGFKVLERMARATRCEINLLLTDGCLYECPYRQYHYTLCGHASQTYSNRAYQDYPVIACSMAKLADPAEIMKCRWVRPEDIRHYEAIGIKSFKIGGRRLTTDRLLLSVKAYSERRYDGNLADILEGFSFIADGIAEERPGTDSIKPHLRIDNTKLDGFIDFFKEQDCDANCGECNYCAQWAKKAITMNKIGADIQLFSLGATRKNLNTSRFFGLDHESRRHARRRAVGS